MKMNGVMTDIREALRPVEHKHGATFELTRRPGNRDRLTLRIARDEAHRVAGNRQHFDEHAPAVGLAPKHYGKQFTLAGREYELVGVNPRARAFAAIVTSGGKLYRLDASAVRRAIERKR